MVCQVRVRGRDWAWDGSECEVRWCGAGAAWAAVGCVGECWRGDHGRGIVEACLRKVRSARWMPCRAWQGMARGVRGPGREPWCIWAVGMGLFRLVRALRLGEVARIGRVVRGVWFIFCVGSCG